MCGRTSLFEPRSVLEERFGAEVVDAYRPRYNVAPGAPLEVVTGEAPGTIARYSWGLLPRWADDAGDGFVNARAETAAEKPAFADAWADRPCLVLSSGYYEWRRIGGTKQPYRVHRRDDDPFAMAGLWQRTTVDGVDVPSVTVLTTEPNDAIEPIHDRMPVVLAPDEESRWLAGDPEEREGLCRPYPGDDLAAYPVSTRVNDPGNDDERVLEPAGTEQSGLDDWAA